MTRILVQRGSSSSNSWSSSSSSLSASVQHVQTVHLASSSVKDEEPGEEIQEHVNVDDNPVEIVSIVVDDRLPENSHGSQADDVDCSPESVIVIRNDRKGHISSLLQEEVENEGPVVGKQKARRNSNPPPPPVPPPELFSSSSKSRRVAVGGSSHQRFGSQGGLNSPRIGPSRRTGTWSIASSRTSPNGSNPSSPRNHHCESEGYNSADEHGLCYESSYNETEKEHQFEIDIKCAKGFEIRRMLEDGNCLFRAVADQVYGDSEVYDMVRQMCIDYLENERDHFSQFITEGFTSYCMRKRRDKVYGNNMEIESLAEMYNRPIHIYCYSTEPINIFQRSYDTDTPPIQLSYHHGNHYNSLFDPRRLTVGVGLGFSSLQGRNIDKDQVKAAIRAQQDQQIEKALLAEGRFYSDLELTEKEMERMVMQASRADYIAKQSLDQRKTSTSGVEPSSSGIGSSGASVSGVSLEKKGREEDSNSNVAGLSISMQMVLSMGFSYLQAIEASNIFGDDVDSMVCYLVEMGNTSSYKGKATE